METLILDESRAIHREYAQIILQLHQDAGESSPPQDTGSILAHELDWAWPSPDIFTDDSVAPRTSQTCSELGSERIRLVRILHRGRSSGTIECETRVCFFSEAGEYTALSYAWGSPLMPSRIFVDREPRQITANLWRFLRQAAQQPGRFFGWLWIDALSIDQADPWEKLEQVKIISKIFHCAKETVVWLGPSYGGSDKAMKVLATLDPYGRPWRSLYAPPLGPAILGICERAYWRRLWVFQEMKSSLSAGLMCGARHLDFAQLQKFLLTENVDERVDVYYKNRLRQSSAAQMVKLTREDLDTSLRSMLNATGHLRCSDPRDKVYATLSTINSGHQDIEADYTTTLPQFLNKILRNMHHAKDPGFLAMVGRECDDLAKHFGVAVRTMHDGMHILWDVFQLFSPHLYRDSDRGFLLWAGDQLGNITALVRNLHTWCKRYDHRVVAALVRKELVFALEPTEAHFDYLKKKAAPKRKAARPCLVDTGPLEELRGMIRWFDDIPDPV